MNLLKAKILLDKINRLYTSMSLDEANVAPIEKDLMKDYIKQLYDAFLSEETGRNTTISKAMEHREPPVPKATYAPPPVRKVVVEAAPPPPPPPPPVVEEIAPTTREEEPAPALEKTVVVNTPPPKFEPATVKPRPIRITTPPPVGIDPNHEELFEQDVDNKGELSERLSLTPIDDINKAIGFNERIYNVNELFGADNTFYRNVIKDLNALKTFEEAKAYLSANVASKYDWTSRSKRTIAKKFIKIIRRRYI